MNKRYKVDIPNVPSYCYYSYCPYNKENICDDPRKYNDFIDSACHKWKIERLIKGLENVNKINKRGK